ncbi:MAG: HAD-IIA family hydrolase [Oligoflexales bacterium]|nr:HAD-IIA family hydrolase [Oligoflexales bacterium]
MVPTSQYTTSDQIIEKYDVVLLDSYGVLVNAQQAISGASEFLDRLNANSKQFFIVTNGSSQSVENTVAGLKKKGINVLSDQVITSGSLVSEWILQEGLDGCKVYLLGPASSHFVFEGTSCRICKPDDYDFDLLIVTNQTGYPFLEGLESITSALIKQFNGGKTCRMLLPNPDLIYPTKTGVGYTSGMVAHCIEAALSLRFGEQKFQFERLGKPYAPIFQKTMKLARSSNVVMIGDQLATDIKGAVSMGIDSVLIGTGITSLEQAQRSAIKPTYLMKSFLD